MRVVGNEETLSREFVILDECRVMRQMPKRNHRRLQLSNARVRSEGLLAKCDRY